MAAASARRVEFGRLRPPVAFSGDLMSLLTRLLPAILLAASPPLAFAAGDLSNSSVYSETDASNSTGTDPGWPEGMAPSRVNDAARALQGALKRDWDRRGPTVTSAGTDTIT